MVRHNFLVVGAGYSGLATAIELKRRGYEVDIFEATTELTSQGDTIQLSSYATRIMRKWGNVFDKSVACSSIIPNMRYFDDKGNLILHAPLPQEFDGNPILYCKRGEIQLILYEHARRIGIKFHFGVRIKDYFETSEIAGFHVNGQRYEGCAVIAADGIHSHARTVIAGKQSTAKTSGFAIYRCWFDLDLLRNDPLTKFYPESPKDEFDVWLGPDTHCIVLTNTKLRGAVCFVTYKDKKDSNKREDWSLPGRREDMLEVIKDWDDKLKAVVNQIPKEHIIDWKLLWRDPAKKWVSDGGRIVLVGDAAHPHLPTSGSGGGQALEDGATIGALIGREGTDNIPTLFRAFEKLRYERTSLTQRLGWETRHRWHQTNWDEVKKDPSIVKMPQPAWLYGANAEQYTIDNMDAAIKAVKDGLPFRSTNVPEGHVHEDWTVESMMELEKLQAKDAFYKASTDILRPTRVEGQAQG